MEQQNIKFNRLTGIRIQNFRSIKDSGKINIKDFTNIIIGKNDVGKSNILDALKIFNNKSQLQSKFFRTGTNRITITLFFELSNKFDIFETIPNIKKLTEENKNLIEENKKFTSENKELIKKNEETIKENKDLIEENTDIGLTKIFNKYTFQSQPSQPFAFFTRKLFYKNLQVQLIKEIETKIEKQFSQQEAKKITEVLMSSCKELTSKLKNNESNIFTEHDTDFANELVNKIGEIQTIKQLLPKTQSMIESAIYLEFIFYIKKDFDNFFSENTKISNLILAAIEEIYKIEHQIKTLTIGTEKFSNQITVFVPVNNPHPKGTSIVSLIEEITDITFKEIYEDYPNSRSKFDEMNQKLKESYENYWIKDDQFPAIRLEGEDLGSAKMKIYFKELAIDKNGLNIPKKYIEFGFEDKSAGKRLAFTTWLQIESFSKTQNQTQTNAFTFLILDEPTNNLHETAQKEFLSELKKTTIKNHFYIFLATHSIALFEWNYLDNIIVAWKNSKKSNHTSVENILDFWTEDNKINAFLKVKERLTQKIGLVSSSLILDLRYENNIFVEGFSDFKIFQLMFEHFLNKEKKGKYNFRFISFSDIDEIEKCDDLFMNKNSLFIFDSDENGLNKKLKLISKEKLSEEQIILLNKNDKELGVTIEDLFEDADYQKIMNEYLSNDSSTITSFFSEDKKYLGRYIIWALKEKKYNLISEETKNNFSIIFNKILDFFNKEKIDHIAPVIEVKETKIDQQEIIVKPTENIQKKKKVSKKSWAITGIVIECIIIVAAVCLFFLIN